MKIPRNAIADVLEVLLTIEDSAKATKYLNETTIVRATKRCYKRSNRRYPIEVLLTIGKPNFRERKFIKDCKKAKEQFPVKKVQLEYRRKN